jgi:hypothetical protein
MRRDRGGHSTFSTTPDSEALSPERIRARFSLRRRSRLLRLHVQASGDDHMGGAMPSAPPKEASPDGCATANLVTLWVEGADRGSLRAVPSPPAVMPAPDGQAQGPDGERKEGS